MEISVLVVTEDSFGILLKAVSVQLVIFSLVQDVKELATVDASTFLQPFGMVRSAYVMKDTKV